MEVAVLEPTPHALRQGAEFLPGESVKALAEEAIRAGAMRNRRSRFGAVVKVRPLRYPNRIIVLQMVDRDMWRPTNVRRVRLEVEQ